MKRFFLFFAAFCCISISAFSQQNDNDYFNYFKAFTPNGDGVNDTWQLNWNLKVDSFSIKVFNRWGEEVYTSTNSEFIWDGKNKKQKPVDMGTYFFTVSFYYLRDKEKVNGSVTLIR